MKIAYFCEPQVGGTYTFFRSLRPILAGHGIDLRCVPPLTAADFRGSPYEKADGIDFLDLPADPHGITRVMLDHLVRQKFDMVMVLPAADPVSCNLPRYLPRSIRAVMRVPMMTRGAYAPARAMAAHLDRIYAVSDRIADDLTGRYGLAREQLEVIYHGVNPVPFDGVLEQKSHPGPLRLLYAGRLWDIDKGIFLLPVMMKKLQAAGVAVHLTVAGHGPDGEELERRFQQAGVMGHVTLAGAVPGAQMPDYYRAADCFIFPSRFEGCGFAVLEAMAAGCAPVVADIRGSLRVLVEDGRAGQLARVGDGEALARGVLALARDRDLLRKTQEAARARVLSHYTLERMARSYAESFHRVLAAPDHREPVCDLARYEMPEAFRPTWRTLIPRPVKNLARTWLERMGISS